MADFEEVLRQAGRSPKEAAALGTVCVTRGHIATLIEDFRVSVLVNNLAGNSFGTAEQQKAVQTEEAALRSGKSLMGGVTEQWEHYFDVNLTMGIPSHWNTPITVKGATITWNELHELTVPAEGSRPALAMSDVMDRWARPLVTQDGYVVSDNSKLYTEKALAGQMEQCSLNVSSNDTRHGLKNFRYGGAVSVADHETVAPLAPGVVLNSAPRLV